MGALCVNERRGRRTVWTPHIVLMDGKTTGREGSENVLLSAVTVITFHSNAFFTHTGAGMWVCDTLSTPFFLVFTQLSFEFFTNAHTIKITIYHFMHTMDT